VRRSGVERMAAVWLALEALGILLLAVWEIVALVTGDTDSAVSSIALLALTVIGAAAVGGFAAAVWRGGSWGRSGGVVVQLLVLSIAIGSLTGPGADAAFAAVLATPAAMGLILLILAARAAGHRARNAVDEV
jgi:hypothetical protein